VESGSVLDRFNSRYLGPLKYTHSLLIEAHDPRFINVALLSRYPITNIRTHKDEKDKRQRYIFSRDCLEVDVSVNEVVLTLYINHFKAMNKGREATRERREAQAKRVVEIIDRRWKNGKYWGNFCVLGDLNDFNDGESALYPLFKHRVRTHLPLLVSFLALLLMSFLSNLQTPLGALRCYLHSTTKGRTVDTSLSLRGYSADIRLHLSIKRTRRAEPREKALHHAQRST